MEWTSILNDGFAILITIFMGYVAFMSSVIVSEQKESKKFDKHKIYANLWITETENEGGDPVSRKIVEKCVGTANEVYS